MAGGREPPWEVVGGVGSGDVVVGLYLRDELFTVS